MVGRAAARKRAAPRTVAPSALVLGVTLVLLVVAAGNGLFTTASPSASRVSELFHPSPAFGHPPTTGAAGAANPRIEPASGSGAAPFVVRTLFPDYNASIAGGFTGSVWDWQVGTPAYVPSTQTIWLPVRSVAALRGPVPTFDPAVIYAAGNDSFEGFDASIQNSAAFLYDPVNGYLYSADFANGTVGVVDPGSGAWIQTIEVGSEPTALALNSSSNLLYVANEGSNNISVIDCATESVSPLSPKAGAQPIALALDPSDNALLALDNRSSNLQIINLATGVNSSLPLAGDGSGIVFDPQEDEVGITMASQSRLLILDASTLGSLALPTIGSGFGPITTNSTGDEFVAGQMTYTNTSIKSNLTLVNASTDLVTGSPIPVGVDVTQLLPISAAAEIAAWGAVSRNLTIVNLTTSSVAEASTTLGPEPVSQTYDPALNRLYTVSSLGGRIDVLNATSGAAVAVPWWFGSPSYSVAFDAHSGNLFVGTQVGVDAVSPSTGNVLYSTTAVAGDAALYVDDFDGYLWEDAASSGLVALSLSDLSEAFTLPITAPAQVPVEQNTMALDPSLDDLFVVNESAHDVEEVDVATQSIVATSIAPGSGATVVAFDPADAEVYSVGVAASGEANVTIIDPASALPVGPPIPLPIRGFPTGIAFDPSSTDILVTTVQSNLTEYAGTLTLLDGSSPAAATASQIVIPLGELSLAPVVGGLPGTPSTSNDAIWVANAASGTIDIVGTAPTIVSFAPTINPIDVGQTTEIRLATSGGTGPITPSYFDLPAGCVVSPILTLTCAPTLAGNYTLSVVVEDTFGLNASSTTWLNVSTSFSVALSTSSADVPPALDVGMTLTAFAHPSGGTPGDTFAWNFGDGSTATGSVVTHNWSKSGAYVMTVIATDSSGDQSVASTPVVVASLPIATFAAAPGNLTDVELPVTFTSAVTGGSGYVYASWSFGDGTTATGLNATHTWTSSGIYQVTFRYTDRAGNVSTFSEIVHVASALTAAVSAGVANSSSSLTTGSNVSFVASITGGTAPYSVSWSFGDGSSGSGSSTTHAYANAGTYRANVTIVDAAGAHLTESVPVTISAPSTSSFNPLTSSDFELGIFFGILIGLAVALVVMFFAGRHRRRPRRPTPASPYVPPGEVGTPSWRED